MRICARSKAVLLAAAALTCSAIGIIGCDDDDNEVVGPEPMSAFELKFAAVKNGAIVECGDMLGGFGPAQSATVEVSDLRFYVSNLRFYDADGAAVPIELNANEFQYASDEGDVALIDLTDTSAGACAGEGLSYPEGTARTNRSITGMTHPGQVRRIAFDVGVPQSVQKAVIENHTAEDAPSPLAEMHWSWGYAYRNFVMNFTVLDGGVEGEGYLHVGSTDCGGDGSRALTDRQSCGKPNAPAVVLESFSLTADTVAIDLGALLAGLDFRVTQSDTSSVTVPGVACHSSTSQPDCDQIFNNLGVEMADGGASAFANGVFKVR